MTFCGQDRYELDGRQTNKKMFLLLTLFLFQLFSYSFYIINRHHFNLINRK